MLIPVLKYSFQWLILILLQGLVFNNIYVFGGYGIPLIYIFILLKLPFETPKWFIYIIAFFTGLSIDAFTNTSGMHASACVTLALARVYLVKLLTPRDGYESGTHPSVQALGLNWWISYSSLLIFVHHFWLFSIEVFRFQAFGQVLLRTIASTLVTFVLLLLAQYTIGNRKK